MSGLLFAIDCWLAVAGSLSTCVGAAARGRGCVCLPACLHAFSQPCLAPSAQPAACCFTLALHACPTVCRPYGMPPPGMMPPGPYGMPPPGPYGAPGMPPPYGMHPGMHPGMPHPGMPPPGMPPPGYGCVLRAAAQQQLAVATVGWWRRLHRCCCIDRQKGSTAEVQHT